MGGVSWRPGLLALVLTLVAGITPSPAHAANWASPEHAELVIVECRRHPQRVDCDCLAQVIAGHQRADPDRKSDPHVATSQCPNLAGIKAQEAANCTMMPSSVVPEGIDVRAYCECLGTQMARAYQALGPVQQTVDTPANLRSDARGHCNRAVTQRTAEPGGLVLTGIWHMEYGNSRFDLTFNPWRGTTAKAEDGRPMKVSVGFAVWKGGTGSIQNVSVNVFEEPVRKFFRAGVEASSGCELQRISDTQLEGDCGTPPHVRKLRIVRRQ